MQDITKDMSNQQRSLEDHLYLAGWIFLIAGSLGGYLYLHILAPVLNAVDWECMIYRLLGWYCPGCGGTRAVRALLQGHFLRALWYHPLVPYTAVIFGWFMVSQTLARLQIGRIRGLRFREWHLYAALGIVIVNFIVKNLLLHGFGITL